LSTIFLLSLDDSFETRWQPRREYALEHGLAGFSPRRASRFRSLWAEFLSTKGENFGLGGDKRRLQTRPISCVWSA
jgi:hypothetical protein